MCYFAYRVLAIGFWKRKQQKKQQLKVRMSTKVNEATLCCSIVHPKTIL